MLSKNLVARAALAIFLCGLVIAAAQAGEDDPTPESYVAHVGGSARIVAPGRLSISGRIVRCGRRPTVINTNLDDYGAAYPGFLILNPNKLAHLPVAVQLWIYAHECAHQFRGPDEQRADCFAVQRGRRQGWLSPAGIKQICEFIRPAIGDSMHFSGPHRCQAMKRCYKARKVY